MLHIRIYDRRIKKNIDWYDISENELEEDMADIIRKKHYYADCDILVNGVLKFSL